ncbi:MAG: tetratricopeptide repeat protein [Haliscomenobacter sp.]|nr:tetratricopeptide repeat protein [Haliscomenobacter sp.]
MRTILLSAFFFALALHAGLQAQQPIDSLRKATLNARQDTHLVWTYRQLFRELYALEGKENEALDVAQKGLSLCRKLNFETGTDLFLFYNATVLDVLGRSQEAIPYFEEGLALSQKRKDSLAMADYRINLGVTWYQLGVYDKSLENYLSAYHIYEALGDREKLSKVLNNIGIMYLEEKSYDRAIDIYQKSIGIKQGLSDSSGLAATYQNLGSAYDSKKDEEKAISNLKKALQIYELLDRPRDAAGCRVSLGKAYLDFGKTAEAKSVLLPAIRFYEAQADPEYTPTAWGLVGKIARQEGDFTQAESFFKKGLALAQSYDRRETILSLLEELAEVQQKLNKPAEALSSFKMAYALRDSMTEERRLSLIKEMQTRFDVIQKDKDLQISQIELRQRTRQKNNLLLLALLLGVLSIVIFFGLRGRMRANKKIAAQESEIQRQEIRRLEQENKLTALSSMLEGQEKERSRIANDLHDGLGGLLASLKSHIGRLLEGGQDAELASKTNRLIDDAAGEVRRIAHNMMPRALALSGLPGALEDLAQDLRKQGLDCDLEIIGFDPALPLDSTQAVMIYRIVQELSHNAVKHAEATHLLLQLLRQEDRLTIIVEDNGQGFDVKNALQQKGLGLSSIESRVQFLQGTIEWDSVPGEGTTVVVTVDGGRKDG